MPKRSAPMSTPTTYLQSIWSIAKNTYREIIRDRLLYGILAVALLVTASSFFLSTISLEQNNRVLENVGLASIHLFSFFICVFVATTSMARDLERRALYLLFSKPISRSQYVLGKFVGFLLLLLTCLAILGGLLALGILFTSKGLLLAILINLVYSFLEVSFLLAWAVLFASFTAPLNAALYTTGLLIIGHSLQTLQAYAARFSPPLVQKFISICYYLLPNLEKFNVRYPVLYGIHVPFTSFFWSLIYWLVYGGLVLFLAMQVTRTREV